MDNDFSEHLKDNIIDWVSLNLGSTFEFRDNQFDAIYNILYNILVANNETSIIQAPTGSGKSLMLIVSAGVLADYYNKTSYILASDLFLWEQYKTTIVDYNLKKFGYLKGSTGNYKCNLTNTDYSVGRCKMEKVSLNSFRHPEWVERHGEYRHCLKRCQYLKDRFRAERSSVTLMTYQLWLYQMNLVNVSDIYVSTFKQRDVIFCDECHNIPDIIQMYGAPVIDVNHDRSFLTKILDYSAEHNLCVSLLDSCVNAEVFASNHTEKTNVKFNDVYTVENIVRNINYFYDSVELIMSKNLNSKTDLMDVLKDYYDVVNMINNLAVTISDIISEEMQDKNLTSKERSFDMQLVAAVNWISTYKITISEYIKSIISCGDEFLVCEFSENPLNKRKIISYYCAKEDYLCYNYLLKNAKYKVLTSATVGDRNVFKKNIGIDYTSRTLYEDNIPSTFNFEKSPIYVLPMYKMNQSSKRTDFPKIADLVYKIINSEKFYNKKGIINTHSYDNAVQLYNMLPKETQDRIILYNTSREKNDSINAFRRSKNKILIGPTLTEGVDFPDDYCRFIIIIKMPYPNLGSKLVCAKKDLLNGWYEATTSNTIIQNIGRGVRNENDYCVTFIVDGCFDVLYNHTRNMFPVEIQQRIQYINN